MSSTPPHALLDDIELMYCGCALVILSLPQPRSLSLFLLLRLRLKNRRATGWRMWEELDDEGASMVLELNAECREVE